jgi:hypothetical protein
MPGGRPGGPSVGERISVVFAGASSAEAYATVAEDRRKVVLSAVRDHGRVASPGETVTCVSVTGAWQATVRSLEDGVLELDAPPWLQRGTERRWPRVSTDLRVTLELGDEHWAGRLVDLSVGGGAVLVEAAAALRPGTPVELLLPESSAGALVRTIRPHAHRLLVVAGMSWARLSTDAQRWVAAEMVAARLKA